MNQHGPADGVYSFASNRERVYDSLEDLLKDRCVIRRLRALRGWRIDADWNTLLLVDAAVAWADVRYIDAFGPEEGLDKTGFAESDQLSPPAGAKFLALLIPKKNRVHLLGDLEEEYFEIVLPEYGCFKAKAWYWASSDEYCPATFRTA